MIGRIVGNVIDKSPDGVLLDVRGVGYDLSLPLTTLASLPAAGESVTLSVHTHVREDDIRLFGFASKRDRTAFRTMLKVSGVGPKLALAVLGGLSGDELAETIRNSDAKRLSAIPGIGKKTAERMILELGGKLSVDGDNAATGAGSVLSELSSALTNLGFKSAAVDRAVTELRKSDVEGKPFEVLLREALGLLKEK